MSELVTTVPVRLYPTPDQAALLRAHCQESIRTITVLVQALDSGVLPNDGQDAREHQGLHCRPAQRRQEPRTG